MTYFRRLPFVLIVEKALTFIRDSLDVFRRVRRDDNRITCISSTPDNVRQSLLACFPCMVAPQSSRSLHLYDNIYYT